MSLCKYSNVTSILVESCSGELQIYSLAVVAYSKHCTVFVRAVCALKVIELLQLNEVSIKIDSSPRYKAEIRVLNQCYSVAGKLIRDIQ